MQEETNLSDLELARFHLQKKSIEENFHITMRLEPPTHTSLFEEFGMMIESDEAFQYISLMKFRIALEILSEH